jgi:hypothetical protein
METASSSSSLQRNVVATTTHTPTHVPIVATFGRNYEEVRARAQEDAIAEKCSEVKRRDRDREK